MKFGRVRIEDGYFIFSRHMMINNIPCGDILWAYTGFEEASREEGEGRHLVSNSLIIHTRQGKRYTFEMTGKEADACLSILRALNPQMALGFPRGGRVPLESLLNTRDLGAIETLNERHIVPGKLLRSGDLYHLSQRDQRILLEDYRLKKVIDFRSTAEMQARPDTVMAGVEYYHLPILDEEDRQRVHAGSIHDALELVHVPRPGALEDFYEAVITDRYSVRQFARFLDILRQESGGAILWHGGMGKDRTGMATALVLTALGVSRKNIREDYMRSQAVLKPERRYIEQWIECLGPQKAYIGERLDLCFKTEESCMNRFFYAVNLEYGSMQRFFARELYMTPRVMDELRELYLL